MKLFLLRPLRFVLTGCCQMVLAGSETAHSGQGYPQAGFQEFDRGPDPRPVPYTVPKYAQPPLPGFQSVFAFWEKYSFYA